MTRFARARGSKASNEKLPEDGTPWEVMKQQLLESKKQNEDAKQREEMEQKRQENYQNFLKEQKTQKRKASWCDFPGSNPVKKKNVSNGNVKHTSNTNNTVLETKIQSETTEQKSTVSNEESSTPDGGTNLPKKKKNKKNKTKQTSNDANANELSKQVSSEENIDQATNSTEDAITNKKKKAKKSKPVAENASVDNNTNKSTPDTKPPKQKKKKKFDDKTKATRRKPINDNSFQLIINGKEVDLARFEGFPIMKKDADRLSELKANMIKKGIPKSEVQRTIKLERRRAEKALARLKRDVCYNCRKGGHNLSDCPELKSKIPGVDAGDGMCFKCGSTEHRQFECKVQRDKEFRFATCFICKDQGHIARQCPDNPKGLYPNGGGCKLCGDVTHLRKDCPTVKDQKEETSIKLATLNDDEIEGIATQNKPVAIEEKAKKPKKITF